MITSVMHLCPHPHRTEALSDDVCLKSVCLMSVCLSRTSGLNREQRGLGRLKLHRGRPCHMLLGHHFQGQKVKGQLAGAGHIVAASRTTCWYLHQILSTDHWLEHMLSLAMESYGQGLKLGLGLVFIRLLSCITSVHRITSLVVSCPDLEMT